MGYKLRNKGLPLAHAKIVLTLNIHDRDRVNIILNLNWTKT